jgi:hypothetical protein
MERRKIMGNVMLKFIIAVRHYEKSYECVVQCPAEMPLNKILPILSRTSGLDDENYFGVYFDDIRWKFRDYPLPKFREVSQTALAKDLAEFTLYVDYIPK